MYYILKIPYRSKPGSKLPIYGIANYIINDEGQVVQEWAEILEGTKMRGKGGKYGKSFSKKVIKIREEIGGTYDKDILLGTIQIEQFNDYFKKYETTFLNHDKYLTGSNPSGSDYNIKKTPYLIRGGEYNQLMFANFFKKLRITNATKVDLNLRFSKGLKEISLEEYFRLFPKIKQEFLEMNKPLLLALTSSNEQETQEIDTSTETDEYIKIILDEDYLIDKHLTKEEINNKRISVLRRIFKNRMRIFEETDHIFGELGEDMCEAAHIYPVNKIKELPLKDWYMIADNNNGLNLPIQIHKMYDKHFIYFGEDGSINFTDKRYEEQLSKIFCFNKALKIKSKNFGKKIKYIKMYNNDIL